GCDHRCTFCIIPYARGPSRSVPMGLVADQACRLVASGYREIVLTGVDLTAYGADLPGAPNLGQLVRRLLAAVPELERRRVSAAGSACQGARGAIALGRPGRASDRAGVPGRQRNRCPD